MQQLLQQVHNDIIVKLLPFTAGMPLAPVYIGGLFVAAGLIVGWMSLIAMGWIYLERRIAGFIQVRQGPNRVGPYGLLQSLADGIKLLSKEDIIPTGANRFLYELSPVLVFAGAFIPFAALPFSQHLVVADMDLGLFFVLAFGALEVVGILMAGWAPNSKWTLYGGMRLAAQMISYEIPLGLSVLTVIVLSGSLNLTDIVLWQTQGFLFWDNGNTPWIIDFLNWGIFRAPLSVLPAFFLFFIAGLAECKRAPFDLPEAESELVAGFHTEYTGIRFSYFFLAEYCAMYVVSALGAIVFLGGWHWPLPTVYDAGDAGIIAAISKAITEHATYNAGETIPQIIANVGTLLKIVLWHGPIATLGALFTWDAIKVLTNELFGFINLVGKAFVLLFVMVWIRWTLPRYRIDQVMHLCLKVLLPIGLACVLIASFQAVLAQPFEKIDYRARALAENATPTPEPTPVPKAAATPKPAAAAPAAAAAPSAAPSGAAKPADGRVWQGNEKYEDGFSNF